MASVAVRQAGSLHVQCRTLQSSHVRDAAKATPLSAAGPSLTRTLPLKSQVRFWGMPLNASAQTPSVTKPCSCKRAISCGFRWPSKAASGLPKKQEGGGFRLHSVAWLPLVLAVASETLTGEIVVDPSRDIFFNWHLSEEFIKHFYVAFICCFSFGCVYFGSLKDPFYEGEESGYRADGGNGTAHWFYDVKEEDEEASREQLAKQVLALEMAQKEAVRRQLQEQLVTRAETAEPPKEKVTLCE